MIYIQYYNDIFSIKKSLISNIHKDIDTNPYCIHIFYGNGENKITHPELLHHLSFNTKEEAEKTFNDIFKQLSKV